MAIYSVMRNMALFRDADVWLRYSSHLSGGLSYCMDGGDPVDVIYLDVRKAFDTVPYRRLIKKIEAYGIKGGLLIWIENFRSDRRQRVMINGKLSTWTGILSGKTQGSVLAWANSVRPFY